MKKISAVLLLAALVLSLMVPALAEEPAAVTANFDTAGIAKYGNVQLDVVPGDLLAVFAYGDIVTVSFLGQSVDMPLCSNYSDVDSGSVGLFTSEESGSRLAINMGDFATTYGIATKTTHEDKTFEWNANEGVTLPAQAVITLKEAGGYYEQFVMHQLSYTDAREDYADLTDEQFANFRVVDTTGMGKGTLCRSTSPIDPQHNRSSYTDAAIRAAGVTAVINLADDDATAASFEGYAESYYAQIDHIALNMGVDFAAAEFQAKLAEGLRYMIAHPGIYDINCLEGKDRTGFVIAVLECLMGASYDEVVSDYMVTFYNYYGVVPGSEQYTAIANSNIIKTLQKAFDTAELDKADLAAEAADYIKAVGLSDEEVASLKGVLAADNSAAPAQEADIAPAPTEETDIAPAPAAENVYTVVSGDCLWNIAYKYYGKGAMYTKIAQANNIKNANIIYVGQKLVIPAA